MKLKRALAIAAAMIGVVSSTVQIASVKAARVGDWSQLPEPHALFPGKGGVYYSFELENGSRACLVVIDYGSGKWRIRPAISEPASAATSTLAQANNASAATNGGYFNLHGGALSTSYVMLNRKVVADPTQNATLVDNPHLRPFLERILNRSEARFMQDEHGRTVIAIVRHQTPVPEGMKLLDSLQAGPQLLPTVESVDEAFIRTDPHGLDVDAVSARKEAARTAFGITADGHALMLCVAGKGQDPESSGIRLDDLATLMRHLGCVQALNLDGGASSTMYARLRDSAPAPQGKVVCGRVPETLVKSILLAEPIP